MLMKLKSVERIFETQKGDSNAAGNNEAENLAAQIDQLLGKLLASQKLENIVDEREVIAEKTTSEAEPTVKVEIQDELIKKTEETKEAIDEKVEETTSGEKMVENVTPDKMIVEKIEEVATGEVMTEKFMPDKTIIDEKEEANHGKENKIDAVLEDDDNAPDSVYAWAERINQMFETDSSDDIFKQSYFKHMPSLISPPVSPLNLSLEEWDPYHTLPSTPLLTSEVMTPPPTPALEQSTKSPEAEDNVPDQLLRTPTKPKVKVVLTPPPAPGRPSVRSKTPPFFTSRSKSAHVTRNPLGPSDQQYANFMQNSAAMARRSSAPFTFSNSQLPSFGAIGEPNSIDSSNTSDRQGWPDDQFMQTKVPAAEPPQMVQLYSGDSFEVEMLKQQAKERAVRQLSPPKEIQVSASPATFATTTVTTAQVSSEEMLASKNKVSSFLPQSRDSFWNLSYQQQQRQAPQSLPAYFYQENNHAQELEPIPPREEPLSELFSSTAAAAAAATSPWNFARFEPTEDFDSLPRRKSTFVRIFPSDYFNNLIYSASQCIAEFEANDMNSPNLGYTSTSSWRDVCNNNNTASNQALFGTMVTGATSNIQRRPSSFGGAPYQSFAATGDAQRPSSSPKPSNGQFGQIFGLNYFAQMPVHLSTNVVPFTFGPSTNLIQQRASSPTVVMPSNVTMTTMTSVMPGTSMSLTPSSVGIDQQFLAQIGKDDLEVRAKDQREAASHVNECEAVFSIDSFDFKPPVEAVYSPKVFLGGTPWEMDNGDMIEVFRQYGACNVQRPGKDVRLSRASQGLERAGYMYLLFDEAEDVNKLINACKLEFSENGHKYFYTIASKRTKKDKRVQVIPWNTADSVYPQKNPPPKLDASRTVFLGALHGMMNAQSVAQALSNMFGYVEYVSLDTDRYHYPTGAGRAVFVSHESYLKAIKARFVRIKSDRFEKTVSCLLSMSNKVFLTINVSKICIARFKSIPSSTTATARAAFTRRDRSTARRAPSTSARTAGTPVIWAKKDTPTTRS